MCPPSKPPFLLHGIESHAEELLDHDPQPQQHSVLVSSGWNRCGRVPRASGWNGPWFVGGSRRAVDLAGGSTELVLDKSVIVGGPGPLVRVADSDPARTGDCSSSRASWPARARSSSGPGKSPGRETKPLSIRAFGSVFGRLHGVGVASVISSSSSADGAAKQIDWGGDNNLFAGWKGFFASGSDPTVTIPDLAEVRSTWNRAERESQEILPPWPHPARSGGRHAGGTRAVCPQSRNDLAASGPASRGSVRESRRRISVSRDPSAVGMGVRALGSSPRKGSRAVNACTASQLREGTSAQATVTASATRAELAVGPIPSDLTFDTRPPHGTATWEHSCGTD